MKLTIVSFGSPGVDRGAMDAAIRLGLDYGGWAPAGFDAPTIYATHLRASASPNAGMVRRLNVQDSDGVLVLSFAVILSGIGAFVDKHAEHQGKSFMNVVLGGPGSTVPDQVRADVLEWIASNDITRLYVTGPSEDAEPGIQAAARDVLVWMLEDLAVEELGELTEAIKLIGTAVDATKPIEGDQPA